MMNVLASFTKDRSGSAGAEMALMLPLMLAVIFTTFEAGHYFYTEQKVIKAVRQGARYAGRLPFANYTCPATIDAAVATQIRTVTRTGSLTGTTPLIKDWTNNDITVSVACNSGTTTGVFKSNVGGAPVVTVAATAPYTSLFSQLLTSSSATQVRASAQATVNGI